MGNTIYVGGSFTQAIRLDGNQRVDRRNLAAFDATIVRINGVEAYRFNMPTTAINFRTRAAIRISGDNERLDRTITFDPLLVVPGTNVITVEVHRDSFGSSDITFLASLTGRF